MEFIKIRISQATPVPNTFGGVGGACTLSFGAIWKPVDCGGGVTEIQTMIFLLCLKMLSGEYADVFSDFTGDDRRARL